jgi:hypothetical protein
MREIRLFRLANLEFTAAPSALYASIILFLLNFSFDRALLLGLGAVLLHWLAALVHQLGHAWAAAQTGYPMRGVVLGVYGLLGGSRYPNNEPELPGKIHIRRALGGPAFSVVLGVVAGLVALALPSSSPSLRFLFIFLFLDSLLVFTFGAFIPLGFNDGSTILKWRGK